MRLAMLFCLGIFVLAQPRLARPQDTGNSLRFYTVHIGAGYGVYLENGIVITVAHVTDLEPRVSLADRELPAKVLKRDGDADLALLSIDKGLPGRLGLHHVSSFAKIPQKPTNRSWSRYRREWRDHMILSPSLLPR